MYVGRRRMARFGSSHGSREQRDGKIFSLSHDRGCGRWRMTVVLIMFNG